MSNYYKQNIKDVMKLLDTKVAGLTSDEVKKRQASYGENIIIEGKKKSKFMMFLSQFDDLMIIILIIAAGISFAFAIANGESFIDGIIIIIIVIINAIMGYIQNIKADKSLEALKSLSTPTIKVKRNDKIEVINTKDVVIGDILVLEAGDTVPADARIISSISLKVDESILTGESDAVLKNEHTIKKDATLANTFNMIYAGCSVVYGKCVAVVTSIGMNTELGKIAKSLSNEENQKTPLEIKIGEISKTISLIIVVIIAIMFVVGSIRGFDGVELLILSISLAVAAIPEGLPAVITIILSLGVSDMAKKNAIVRNMSSVETLGCTEVICSDKTGTITQNKMKVTNIYYNEILYRENEHVVKPELLFNAMSYCNDVSLSNYKYIGDPTEIALVEYLDNLEYITKGKRVFEVPFDSDRKMMSTVIKEKNKIIVYSKGSLESILAKCKKMLINNKLSTLNENRIKELQKIEKDLSKKSLRMVAFAYKELKELNSEEKDNVEENLVFLGIVGMIDPPRENALESVKLCKNAGIRTIMITGDSINTAVSVAKSVGILTNNDEAILGSDIDNLSDLELKEAVNKYNVYARVTPEHKIRIVKALQSHDKVVAMTGDGVNDAPALKAADIGIGMGITGTEVSKNVSDIVLADDSINTIVAAVKEGRRIYDNIRNVILYLLTGNIAEVSVVFVALFYNIEIFSPIHLLYINLITDSIPAISLAFEKESNGIMNRRVRSKKKPFFTKFMISRLVISSLFKTLVILLIFYIGKDIVGPSVTSTMCFLCLIALEMLYAFTCKDLKKSVLNKKRLFNNPSLNKSILFLILIQIIIFNTPIKAIFDIVQLSLLQIIISIGLALVVFILDEISKKKITKTFED